MQKCVGLSQLVTTHPSYCASLCSPSTTYWVSKKLNI
jgi:hypothetical protein